MAPATSSPFGNTSAGVPLMPEGVTPEKMCDWNYMTGAIAAKRKPITR